MSIYGQRGDLKSRGVPGDHNIVPGGAPPVMFIGL